MKRISALIFVLLMLISLASCGKKQEKPSLQVGYGRADITPTTPMPLAGYGDSSRVWENVLDPLYVSCVAITDEKDQTVLLLSMDLINSSETPDIRIQVSQATGVPKERIMVAATHTHSAPDQSSNKSKAYVSSLHIQAANAAKQAMEDRAAAKIYIGYTDIEGLNFIRHYKMKDGTYSGDNFGTWNELMVEGHATQNDPRLQVIRFARTGSHPSINMVNWQAHPCLTGGIDKTDVSADFVGSARAYVERQTDEHFIYFTGAAGNHNTKSKIPGETRTTDNQEYGRLLGDYVLDVLQNMTPADSGELRIRQMCFEGKVNHEMEDMLTEANEVSQLFKQTDRATGNKLAHQYGFSSVYHANAVIRRSRLPETLSFELNAISVGGISFVAAPYEMFAAHGMYIKEQSPFDMTFILSCTNGSNSYLPTQEAFEYGCYESHVSSFVATTGQESAQACVELLEECNK